jgi:hypothetical protein
MGRRTESVNGRQMTKRNAKRRSLPEYPAHGSSRQRRTDGGSTMIVQRAPEDDPVMTHLEAARRLVRDLQPYSPAWDAAMAWVDDLEREAGNKWSSARTAEPGLMTVTF